jgi:hypothetical protein
MITSLEVRVRTDSQPGDFIGALASLLAEGIPPPASPPPPSLDAPPAPAATARNEKPGSSR